MKAAMPRYLKGKKPIKKRKPSRPLDGINHRLLNSLKAAEAAQEAADNAPPTRAELETKGRELGLKFDGRTSDRKLGQLIQDALAG